MPDLTGLPAIDVVIGMAFLFFVLATVVASVNEVIQTVLNARARVLTSGIKTLLNDEDKTRAFFEQPRIKRLAKPPGFVRGIARHLPFVADQRGPSYIPARAFALTLLEPTTSDTEPKIGVDLVAEAKKTVAKIGIPSLESAVTTGVTAAQLELAAIRAEIEHAFDEVMDRASGWYKRYVQWWLAVLSLAVAIGLNVNAFTVGERLWKDDALRAAVVQQAQKRVGEDQPETPQSATPKAVADQIDRIDQLKLPIGWDKANTQGDFLARLVGWLVTTAALMLGAPFWFDVLGKLSRLRGSGNREGTAKSDRAAEDRDDPSGARPAAR
jgi:hypothetical protein